MSSADGAENFVFTCVRDASQKGGGVAGVALPLHRVLSEKASRYRLVYEFGEYSNREKGSDILWGGSNPALRGVVHVHGLWSPFEIRACRAALKLGMKLVISPHGMLDPWALRQKRWKKLLAWNLYQRRFLSKADLIVVNSEREWESVRRLGINSPVAVIPNGVAMEGWSDSMVRQRTERTVLFLSRIAPGKGIPELLTAWSRISNKRGYRLRIVGFAEEEYGRKMQALIAKLGVESTVSFEGPVYGRDKWQAFFDADYFILPSHSENFGIVVAEALVSGLPVITTDQTPWQFLAQSGAGWICGTGAQEVEKAIVTAISLPDEQRALMGEKAREVSREYNWDAIACRYHGTYSWLLGEQDRPSWME